MIFAAVLAGGVGSRMNIADMPKQFLPLGDRPILIHTIEKFLLANRIDAVFVGVHPEWLDYARDLKEKYLGFSKKPVYFVAGGKDRNETLAAVVREIDGQYGTKEEHYMLTHDAVRPFVTERIIQDNIDAVLRYDATDTVVSAVDTIVESADGQVISAIPERKKLYQGQTPQSFKVSLFKQYYGELSADEKAILTDACKIFIMRGHPVQLVPGAVSNLKITTVNDYNIARVMVGGFHLD